MRPTVLRQPWEPEETLKELWESGMLCTSLPSTVPGTNCTQRPSQARVAEKANSSLASVPCGMWGNSLGPSATITEHRGSAEINLEKQTDQLHLCQRNAICQRGDGKALDQPCRLITRF